MEDVYIEFKNGQSPYLSDAKLNELQRKIKADIKAQVLDSLKLAFPVGSTYITQTNTNPNSILGFGTWERFKAKVALGLDENENDFKTIGKTGGEKTHTLTVDELAKHRHKVLGNFQGTSGTQHTPQFVNKGYDWIDDGTDDESNLTGGNKPHNNMQPYEIVGYMWIRRA